MNATLDVVGEFDVGILVCLGIAGALSNDVRIGDVCHTGIIADILDNAKVTDATSTESKSGKSGKSGKGAKKKNEKSSGQDLTFSPTHYETPIEISVALSGDRLSPEYKVDHDAWAGYREEFGRQHIPSEYIGRDGKSEKIEKPTVREGTIACASVSGSPSYNKKIRDLDRKILAIETESGGLFAIAKRNSIPGLTIRGISDYAGIDKNLFEKQTNNKARLIAASNAASYLSRQLSRPRLRQFIISRRVSTTTALVTANRSPADILADTLIAQAELFNARLKELAPGYSLQERGYRIPIPRIRLKDEKLNSANRDPIELRDALELSRVSIVQVAPRYPDRSLAWIVGRDLLSSHTNKQVVPFVVEASHLHRPKYGIRAICGESLAQVENMPRVETVFIINEFNFESKPQTQFLLDEVTALPNSKFVIITKDKFNIVSENAFARDTGALISDLDEVSFLEISHFLQKNFQMDTPEAQVVAMRLHETFSNFKLSAHPSYFAGIPANTVIALLAANRRAELIELAVAGYLSYVVSQDDEPVALSRTTREKFLTALAFEMRVNKRLFSEPELANFTEEFAKRFDFKISPVRFIAAFIEKGVLYVEHEKVHFTLPFMESYLLAKRLRDEPEHAIKYFAFGESSFDIPTFAIYAELGLTSEFTDKLTKRLDNALEQLGKETKRGILVSNDISPAIISRQDRIASMRKKLQNAITDVVNDKDRSREKQRLLDAAEQVRRMASKQGMHTKDDEQEEERRTVESDAIEAWYVAVTLLGAGSERLEADKKRGLADRIIRLSAIIIDDWTAESADADYAAIREDLCEDEEMIRGLAKSESEADIAEAKRTLNLLVDLLEFSLISQPFRNIVGTICEEARDKVLAESVVNTQVDGAIEGLVRSLWLSDLDTVIGAKELKEAIKSVPHAKFLRVNIASHLISRVFWRHSNKEHRLKLLSLAQESLKVAGLSYDKAGLQRLIEREASGHKSGVE